jgi:prepilin-type processing-associated H-X9-DG protein
MNDGTSTTVMLTENLQAGRWYDTDTTHIGFGLPVETKDAQVLFGSGRFFESPAQPLNTEFAGGSIATATPRDWEINSDRNAEKGTRPRPSSNHNRSVNAMFCDGSGRELSDRIDPRVYTKLLTSNGVEYGESALTSNSF